MRGSEEARSRPNREEKMPICGWVVTLTPDEGLRRTVVARLAADPRMTLGDARGARLPLVSETGGPDSVEPLAAELAGIGGILFVDLAYADLSDIDRVEGAAPRRRQRPAVEVSP